MESEKVKEIKELLRCMNGEKACTNCHINEIAEEQETCCINIVADMTLDLINELESENYYLTEECQNLNGRLMNKARATAPTEWKLKQFAERLKEKFYYVFGNEYEQSVSGFDTKILIEYIDETLKEFIND